ncbi:unnamed protein product, partial [Tetraodon nigroviridis]
MALMCRQIIGSGASSAGWVGLIVATATNDWVRTCDLQPGGLSADGRAGVQGPVGRVHRVSVPVPLRGPGADPQPARSVWHHLHRLVPGGGPQRRGSDVFGFSLYAGWVGAALCLLGGVIILFCH